jgi:hypothetical protein
MKALLQRERFENVLDSNMFSAYIVRDLPIPKVDDPRKIQTNTGGVERYPGYVRSVKINQIFNYIGFIKRIENREYTQYLEPLFQELNVFLKVMEDIIYSLNVAIPVDIYEEHRRGLENFLKSCPPPAAHHIEWIGSIWKNQKLYLEHIDMLIETLRVRGRVFNFRGDPLYEKLLRAGKAVTAGTGVGELPGETDIRFIANSCVKAARDGESKTLWSGDTHVLRILKHIYANEGLAAEFPQIYLRSGYEPLNLIQIFP